MKSVFVILFCAFLLQTGYTSSEFPDSTATSYYLYYNGPPTTPVWYFTIHAGSGFILGDVRPAFISPANKPAYSTGLTIQRNFYGTGWQLNLGLAQIYGLERDSGAFHQNPALNGIAVSGNNSDFIFPDYTGRIWVPNYSSRILSGSLEFVWGNCDPFQYPYRGPAQLYITGGPGFIAYKTMYDAYNNVGGTYDFASGFANAGHSISNINNLLDGEFETPAELNTDVLEYAEKGKFTFHPALYLSVGFSTFLTRKMYVGIEQRLSYYFDDLADGQQWNSNNKLSDHKDWLFTTGITLGYLKSNDSIIDPFAYWDLIFPEGENFDPEILLRDSDSDGVIDRNDKDPATPPFTPVDTDGVALDSDHDGCSDDVDPEPMSDLRRKMIGCENEIISQDSLIKIIESTCDDCHFNGNQQFEKEEWYFPVLLFKKGSDTLIAGGDAALNQIVEIEKKYQLSLVIAGHSGPSDGYTRNNEIAIERVIMVVNYLLSHGIESELIAWRPASNNFNLIQMHNEEDPQYERSVEIHINNL